MDFDKRIRKIEMTNIIRFPEKIKQNWSEDLLCQKPPKRSKIKSFFNSILIFAQTTLVLLWPFVRWFVYLDLLLNFLRMLMHTNNHATFDFILHCVIVLSGVLFVFFYKADFMRK